MIAPPIHTLPKNESVLLFWESGGEGKKIGADFGFKTATKFWRDKKVSCKTKTNELLFRQEKTRKWHAHISANAKKIRTTSGK